MTRPPFKAPFAYFGGKSAMAPEIWRRLGSPSHYIEPFAGSLAVLLARPDWRPGPRQFTETVNDLDGLLCNFWRAMTAAPEAVAAAADWPVNELDLHARHAHLIASRAEVTERLRADPRWYDAELAGWWVWGAGAWIGSDWCSRSARTMPAIGDTGVGVHRIGAGDRRSCLLALRDRLAYVRVLCGDWRRSVGRALTTRWNNSGPVAVFLDPPYGEGSMDYAAGGNAGADVAADVWAWACESWQDRDPSQGLAQVRICVAGYEDGRAVPDGWQVVEWDAALSKGGRYSGATGEARANARRERLWFSPNCLNPDADRQLGLAL